MQKNLFLSGEGNQWYSRNKEYIEVYDYNEIVERILKFSIENGEYLEIGCSDGSFLDRLSKSVNGSFAGIEPSMQAVVDGKEKYPHLYLKQGTADVIEMDRSFDVIIFGFCLYLCDPEDLFKIAYEANRHLKDGGYIVIKDFYSKIPYKNIYTHLDGVYSHKMDYSKLFCWNPSYQLLSLDVNGDTRDSRIAIYVIQKSTSEAYLNGANL